MIKRILLLSYGRVGSGLSASDRCVKDRPIKASWSFSRLFVSLFLHLVFKRLGHGVLKIQGNCLHPHRSLFYQRILNSWKRHCWCVFGLLSLIFTGDLSAEEKVYTCKFEENIPYGVSAWSQSERVRNGIGKEARFGPYGSGSAQELSNDALVDRGAGVGGQGDPRETAFWQAYDEKGWYIYIESKEPLIDELLNQLVDGRSPGHKESYELFFAPGLARVPYYQLYITPYQNKTTFYDWGAPHLGYRSLKPDTRVESLPLKQGIGTFVFIPWHLLYEQVPLNGGEWRFTVIRWMPFSKAGGMTWGGKVHETGRFGLVKFQKPTPVQRQAIEERLVRYAWFKFQALSDQLRDYWSDAHVGDPEFYEQRLAPEIERLNAEGRTAGNMKQFMEFDYKADALRASHLQQKRFSTK